MSVPYILCAQVTIIPLNQNSEILLFDNLFHVNLINSTGTNIQGYLEITVEDSNNRQSVLKVNSPLMNLVPGITNGQQINWNNTINYGPSQLVNSLASSGRFASGNYVFCYNFISRDGNQYLGVNCQEKPIKLAGVPTLLSPYDKEVIETKNPVLTWRPPLPSFNTNIRYSLVVAPYFKGQSKVEALQRNFSNVQLSLLNLPFQVYPFDAPILEKGKNYVWQVKAYLEGFEVGATEIWEFQYNLPEDDKESQHTESCHFVKSHQDASFYVANKQINFAYKNRHDESILNYKVYSRENSEDRIQNLPEIILESGTNKIIIEADELGNLKHMERYTLVIKSKNKKKYYYNFVYLNK